MTKILDAFAIGLLKAVLRIDHIGVELLSALWGICLHLLILMNIIWIPGVYDGHYTWASWVALACLLLSSAQLSANLWFISIGKFSCSGTSGLRRALCRSLSSIRIAVSLGNGLVFFAYFAYYLITAVHSPEWTNFLLFSLSNLLVFSKLYLFRRYI